ncbi:hypothetical protein [Tabrizicola sp.]|uniref:hypothetical protein n=1 Tax=Tabrizicola sp. TaxID=2005166 RepID=UPI0026399C03|nr:hypothetical protein [Tabrizicola sp.]MDM7933023.1 hypothetical protein [Tabrizicola sp.]
MQTIAEAFTAWTQIEAQFPEADEVTFNHLAQEQARIEDAAVLLPVTSALDGWRLIAMTTEDEVILVHRPHNIGLARPTATSASPPFRPAASQRPDDQRHREKHIRSQSGR